MATQTIDATLFASSHPDIVKRTSVSGPVSYTHLTLPTICSV